MTTPDPVTQHLIRRLANIAEDPAYHVDGTTRIKAAVMVAYLSGRPAPTVTAAGNNYAQIGFRQLMQEFSIQLTDEGLQLTDEGS